MKKTPIDVLALILAIFFTLIVDLALGMRYDISLHDIVSSGQFGPVMFLIMGALVAGVPLYYAIRFARLLRSRVSVR